MRTIEKITESSSTPCMSGFEEKTTLDTIHTEFKLGCASIDEDRSFKVIVIWTGFSGILAGIRFQRMKNIDLTIYEKMKVSEGPGIQIGIHNREPHVIIHLIVQVVQTDWSAFYSPRPEILADLKRVADKYKLMRFFRPRHGLIHASYDEKTGKWHLKLRRQILESQESEIVEGSADIWSRDSRKSHGSCNIVELVTTRIEKITGAGAVLDDGSYNELDVIVCFDTSFQYPFEVVGRGGRELRERYNPYPETYLSLCTDGFPNLFATFGTNSAFVTGSFIPVLEAQVQYVIKVAKKLRREHLKSIEPQPETVADFNEFLEP
ncbi:FAD/NAD-binding domain-containing protein [Sanghuangporus baumii]|uniref:FAD/NAD-binding domain-containing protein n=1 Tax=Sanghuangporus baumii TaxID=108892 RepID=A0A9Q5HYA4_SANBA|nr:FAD/NAD-binding domain-containing protein [Sanghuangporus baumii]